MQERRRYKRKPIAVSLEIYSNGTKQSLGKGFITNLSEGGVALETHKTLRAGEKLMLRFALPNDRTFDLMGEVVYSQDGVITRAYGARFHNVDSATSNQLRRFVVAQIE